MKFAKIGSVCYVIWGLLHIISAIQGFMLAASVDHGLAQGKLNQGAWDLLFFAFAAMTIAVIYNWKNAVLGYWLNLVLVSAADLGFIMFVLVPGDVTIFPSILGPIFWIAAAIFTSLGIASKENIKT
jgi:hypothetical protein